MSPTGEAAMAYASMGWPVIPVWWADEHGVCQCPGRSACDYSGKHPINRHGVSDATTNVGLVEGVWGRYPQANVGLATGIHFDVLDIDGTEGTEALTHLAVFKGAAFPDCWADGPMVRTSKGHHLWYLPTGAGNRAGIVPCVDWRGTGGYVVAPPSTHHTGHVYEWVPNHNPVSDARVPLEAAPGFLVDLVCPAQPAAPWDHQEASQGPRQGFSAVGLLRQVAEASEGTRNARLNWAAWKLGQDHTAGKVDARTLEQVIGQLQDAAISVGLSEPGISRTIRSGLVAGAT